MDGMLDGSSPDVSEKQGRLPAPKVDKTREHGPLGEEASSAAPTKSSPTGDAPIPTDTSGLEHVEVVRGTTKYEIRPALVAEDSNAHQAGTCGRREHCSACALLYALTITQTRVARGMNGLMRRYVEADAAALEDFWRGNPEAAPRAKDWPPVKLNGYQIIRALSPGLDTGIASAAAQKALQAWKLARYDHLVRQSRDRPFFSNTGRIPIRGQEARLVHVTGPRYELSFPLETPPEGSSRKRQFRIPLIARDARQRSELALVAGTAEARGKLQEVTVKKDARGKWLVTLTTKRQVPRLPASSRTAAVNRGICCFLAAVLYDGTSYLVDGEEIEEYMRRIEARRRSIRRGYRSRKHGRGRNKTLRLQALQALSDKVANWRKTKNETVAKNFVDWCSRHQVTAIYLEDFTGVRDTRALDDHSWLRVQSWPYYQLGQRIQSLAEERGIAVVQVSARAISHECPRCGEQDPSHVKLAQRRFVCGSCGFRHHLDLAAALNVRARGEQSGGAAPSEPKPWSKSKRGRPANGGARKPRRNGAKSNGSSKRPRRGGQ